MSEGKYSLEFYLRFFIEELRRVRQAISESTRLKFRCGMNLFSLIYSICTGLVVYVKEYDAGDQALVPFFFSLVGVALVSMLLIIATIVVRFQNKREWSREFQWALFSFLLLYLGVLSLFAKFTS